MKKTYAKAVALPSPRQVQIIVGTAIFIAGILSVTVNSWFITLPILFGFGLLKAGVTGSCPLENKIEAFKQK